MHVLIVPFASSLGRFRYGAAQGRARTSTHVIAAVDFGDRITSSSSTAPLRLGDRVTSGYVAPRCRVATPPNTAQTEARARHSGCYTVALSWPPRPYLLPSAHSRRRATPNSERPIRRKGNDVACSHLGRPLGHGFARSRALLSPAGSEDRASPTFSRSTTTTTTALSLASAGPATR